MDNIVIYDALSITSKIHNPEHFIGLMGLNNVLWQTVKGAHGYQDRLYFECISIHCNGGPGMGIWLEMMGQGCRAFETYGNGNYELLFEEVISNKGDMKITRLDIAFDDHTGILDINELCDDTRTGSYIARANEWKVTEGSKGSSIEIGSMKSEAFIRIYDKAAERGMTDGTHWVRCEMQLRRDRALSFVNLAGDIGPKYSGVLLNYLRYIEPGEADTNRWRSTMRPYWQSLVNDAEAISIYQKPGIEYNLARLENTVIKMYGNAIDTYRKIVGEHQFNQNLKHRNTAANPRYEELKNMYKEYKSDGTYWMGYPDLNI